MTNPIQAIGKDIKTGVEDAGKAIKEAVEFAIVDPVDFTAKTIAVLKSAEKDSPAVKSAFEGLFSQANSLESEIANEIAAKGTNIAEYGTIFTASKALITFIKGTVVPAVETAYKDIKADVNAPDTNAPAAS